MAASQENLRGLYERLLQAWNERSATAMAACFSQRGVMIGFDGSIAEGRSAIERHLSPIFADHPTAAFVALVRDTREISAVGILRAGVGMIPPGMSEANAQANARQTMIAVATGGGWAVELFQNTPAALHWDEAGRTP